MDDTVYEKARRIIAEKVDGDPQTLSRDTSLSELDIQSLELAEIIFDLEDEFDIEIEMNAASAWEKLKTVGDVSAAIEALVSGDGSAAA
jgi:nodulation protein F